MHAMIPLMMFIGPPLPPAAPPVADSVLLGTLAAEEHLEALRVWLDSISVTVELPEPAVTPLAVIRHYAWDGQYLHDGGVLRAAAQFIQRPYLPGESTIILLTPDPD